MVTDFSWHLWKIELKSMPMSFHLHPDAVVIYSKLEINLLRKNTEEISEIQVNQGTIEWVVYARLI